MLMNKKILAGTIVGALFAGSAQAAVDISAAAPATVTFASEAVVPGGGLTLVNAANALDLVTKLKYSFSNGEVRQARIECSANMKFSAGSSLTLSHGTAGAINGLGTNAIYFSITGDATTTDTSTITVGGNRSVSSLDPASCTYALYDTPSQAANGGDDGKIVSAAGAYIKFGNTYGIKTTPATNTADVEANPAYSKYTGGSTRAAIGSATFNLSGAIGGTTPLNPFTGAAMTLADILGAATSGIYRGDFSLAVDGAGNPDKNKVFVSSDGCATALVVANEVNATSATFVFGGNGGTSTVCYQSVGGVAIPVSDYTVELTAVAADATHFNAPNVAATAVGSIVHNGTELQAPLVQVPTGWISRLVLTNTGSVDRAYTISVQAEAGVTVTTANLTGTVKANSTKVINDLNTVMTGFSAGAKPRATLNVSVAAPNKQIQGLYQLVSPEGGVSNYILARPGTN